MVVDTLYGKVRGKKHKGCIHFLGIPFAKPPVGELRFRKPEKPDMWDGIKECTMFGHFCPQPGETDRVDKAITASEDCLSLNIFTPACDNKKRPVVIWIHGGAYLTGCACTEGFLGYQICEKADVVNVSIQYRLGAFGCVDFSLLSGANGRFDSNCGTWDQVAAINWVIENIEAFGGDSECITIMGGSAGATSVLTLITTPYLKGKIKRAVLESPAPFLPLTKEGGRLAALKVIEELGIKEEEVCKLVDMPAEALVEATNTAENKYYDYRAYTIPTAPVVDGDLIPELPFDAVMHGAVEDIDILIGSTADEGTMFATNSKLFQKIFPSEKVELEKFFRENPSVDKEKILALYPEYPRIEAFQEIAKEIFFHIGIMQLAESLEKKNKVYVYYTTYSTPVLRFLGLKSIHCVNTAMLSGEFKSFLGWFAKKKNERFTSQLQAQWGNFFNTGDVNVPGYPEWPEYGVEKNTYFLDLNSYVEKNPFENIQQAYGGIRPYGN